MREVRQDKTRATLAEQATGWVKPLVALAGGIINGGREADVDDHHGEPLTASLRPSRHRSGMIRAPEDLTLHALIVTGIHALTAPIQPVRPQLAVSGAIFRDGKVLLVRRARSPAKGFYSLPGGRVEFGESLHTALHREVDEETGLESRFGPRRLARGAAGGGGGGHYLIMSFAARWTAREAGSERRARRFQMARARRARRPQGHRRPARRSLRPPGG